LGKHSSTPRVIRPLFVLAGLAPQQVVKGQHDPAGQAWRGLGRQGIGVLAGVNGGTGRTDDASKSRSPLPERAHRSAFRCVGQPIRRVLEAFDGKEVRVGARWAYVSRFPWKRDSPGWLDYSLLGYLPKTVGGAAFQRRAVPPPLRLWPEDLRLNETQAEQY
jgi:hypothetical protein